MTAAFGLERAAHHEAVVERAREHDSDKRGSLLCMTILMRRCRPRMDVIARHPGCMQMLVLVDVPMPVPASPRPAARRAG